MLAQYQHNHHAAVSPSYAHTAIFYLYQESIFTKP